MDRTSKAYLLPVRPDLLRSDPLYENGLVSWREHYNQNPKTPPNTVWLCIAPSTKYTMKFEFENLEAKA